MLLDPSADPPGSPQMFDQRLRAILDEHIHGQDSGIQKVAQDEVHDTIFPAERHGRLAPLLGERHQPFAFPSCHDDSQYAFAL